MTHSSASMFAARPRLRAALALSGASLALIALAGCAAEENEPKDSPSSSSTATPKPTATATATATAEPTEAATPGPAAEGAAVDKSCEQILTADDIYAINPNFSQDEGFAATSDTAVTATGYNGVACGWLNQSSGEVIEVSITMPNEILTNSLKDSALAGGEVVPTYGSAPEVEGYFSPSTGTAQVFTGGYWVAVSSPDMIEAGDAELVMATVLENL